jgi:hypothetical protein
MKVTVIPGTQALHLEHPDFAGERFMMQFPEIVSDRHGPIIGWDRHPDKWDITAGSAGWSIDIPNAARMEATLVFESEKILANVTLTNLSDRTWQDANAFTCFVYGCVPAFDDPEMERTFLPVGNTWRSVADVWAESYPGDRIYTFYPVAGGADMQKLWLRYQEQCQLCDVMLSRGAIAAVSSDRQWVAGMCTPVPAFVFNNRKGRCLHACPLMRTVQPGQTTDCASTIHIFRGTLEDLAARC